MPDQTEIELTNNRKNDNYSISSVSFNETENEETAEKNSGDDGKKEENKSDSEIGKDEKNSGDNEKKEETKPENNELKGDKVPEDNVSQNERKTFKEKLRFWNKK